MSRKIVLETKSWSLNLTSYNYPRYTTMRKLKQIQSATEST